MSRRQLVSAVLGGLAAIAGIVLTVLLALADRRGPARCPAGLVAVDAHCCGEGQRSDHQLCTGQPRLCAITQTPTPQGCVAEPTRIAYRGGRAILGSPDWDGARGAGARAAHLNPFQLDATEVTLARWAECESAKACPPLSLRGPPGEPVRGVTPDQAEAFCKFAGGRVPIGAEWLFAAMGSDGRRFPWGATGLVCRRATYGTESGPCATGATGPDLAGARPDGASPDGALDLAGNVAEWTREARGFVARGGSFRSRSAAELKTFSAQATRARPDVGFRCAYAAAR